MFRKAFRTTPVNRPMFGMFGASSLTTTDVIVTLSNNGILPITGERLSEETTVYTTFTDQIRRFSNFALHGIPAAKPDVTDPAPGIYPVEGKRPQGWGLTLMIERRPDREIRKHGLPGWAAQLLVVG